MTPLKPIVPPPLPEEGADPESVADAVTRVPKPDRKSRRHRSRELALQGIYQWRLAGGSASDIEAQLAEEDGFGRADKSYFVEVLHAVLADHLALEAYIQPCLDRPARELSPVEYAILLLGSHELASRPEIPYRAVINEAVELAKTYGGSDGYKYINGVLDKLAPVLRPVETRIGTAKRR